MCAICCGPTPASPASPAESGIAGGGRKRDTPKALERDLRKH
jgi:hypothetical protein